MPTEWSRKALCGSAATLCGKAVPSRKTAKQKTRRGLALRRKGKADGKHCLPPHSGAAKPLKDD